MESDDALLCEQLSQRHHFRLRPAFVAAARRQLQPQEACTPERLHTIALHTDWAACSVGGALTDAALASGLLRGSHVLQIDELGDIANNREDRAKQTDLPSRLLRLRLTDGVASVAAIENKRLVQLSVRTPPGAKLLVTDVPVARRILLLAPDNCRLLGGSVQALVDAHAALRRADASVGAVGGGIVPPSLHNAVPLAAAPPPPPPPVSRPPLVSTAVPPPPPPPRQPAAVAGATVVADGPTDDNDGPGFIDEDLDLSAFLAAEEAAYGARKEVIDLASRSFDPDFDDVDDLVRIVSQVPDWESDGDDQEQADGEEDVSAGGDVQQKRLRRVSSSSSSDKIHATPPGSDSDFDEVIVSNQMSSSTKSSSAVTAISLIDLCEDE